MYVAYLVSAVDVLCKSVDVPVISEKSKVLSQQQNDLTHMEHWHAVTCVEHRHAVTHVEHWRAVMLKSRKLL